MRATRTKCTKFARASIIANRFGRGLGSSTCTGLCAVFHPDLCSPHPAWPSTKIQSFKVVLLLAALLEAA
jgi:hypothetical protein